MNPIASIRNIGLLSGLVLVMVLLAPAATVSDGLPRTLTVTGSALTHQQVREDYRGVSDAALEKTLYVLERLQGGQDAFPATWIGNASDLGDIEVVVIWDEDRILHDFVIPGETGSATIMDELRNWLGQEPQLQVLDHYFLEDEHTRTYANLVLSLPHGVFWMQFDADNRPTKLWVEPYYLSELWPPKNISPVTTAD